MMRIMCKGKIHRARVTKTDLHYQGSIGIDKILLKASDILPYERVQVLNLNNGSRFETYCIEEKARSGIVALYGPAAKLGDKGDLVIVLSYGIMNNGQAKKIKPKVVRVDKNNGIK